MLVRKTFRIEFLVCTLITAAFPWIGNSGRNSFGRAKITTVSPLESSQELRCALAMAMATLSLPSVSPCTPWRASERHVPKLSNSFVFGPARSSPLHHESTSSSSSPRPANLRANKTCKVRAPISMSLQTGEISTADQSAAPQFDELGCEIPTVVEFNIQPESLTGFYADYERVSAKWPADLASTTDDIKFEQFVSSSHALARRWLPEDLVSRLERFMYDPADAPALVIRGLPIDKELPPTELNAHLKKVGKCVSEAWLVGIGRIVGQVFTFNTVRGSRPGMGLLVREIYTTQDKVDHVSAEGSRILLDIHADFFQLAPDKFPNVIAFIGVRGDPDKEGKTLLCNNRKLYRLLDPADIQLLRTEKVVWDTGRVQFSAYVIEGSESDPKFNIFEENLPFFGGFDDVVKGSPELRAAYKRVKETAATLPEGVWLGSGDLLLLNQKKATHGRSPYAARYDGNDRWLQRTYINSGGFWEAGHTQWPNRTLPMG